MAKADFTYQVRSEDAAPVGIEDYVVRASDGEPVGTVGDLLERDGERLLVVVSGVPPLVGERRVVPWRQVERVDHDAVAVWLTLDTPAFEREAPELDRERAVEAGEGDAEARRLDRPPEDLIPAAQGPEVRGPVDRTIWLKIFVAFAATSFTALLATMAVFLAGDSTWALLFLVPASLAVVTAVLAYRAYREPYEPQPARKS